MLWFKKKEKKPEIELKNALVMPDDFYGGKDPVVHYVRTEKTVGDKGKELRAPLKESALAIAHTEARLGLVWLLRRKKFVLALWVIIFVGIVTGISLYYINQAKKVVRENTVVKVPISQPIAPTVEEETTTASPMPEKEIPSTSESETVVTTTEENTKPKMVLEFPSMFLVDGDDLDGDSLTDLEEELMKTDSGVWDTDGDGYYDGQEVFNLYNPKGTAPMKIIDSGLVKEYINPIWQYRLYFPAQWASASVDETASQVLLSALSGDYIEIIMKEAEAGEGFSDWFGREAVGQSFSDLQTNTNKFKESYWQRKDWLAAYFMNSNKVFVLIYHPGTANVIPYKHVMQMVVQSFRPVKTSVTLPEQPLMPLVVEEVSTTTSTATPIVTTSTVEEIL
jgi:hypothetical protein